MKTYHPVEYMAAVLTFEMGSTEKVVEYIEECRRLTLPDGSKGIKVLPPDVNVSDKDFTPIVCGGCSRRAAAKGRRKVEPKPQGVIRFGMVAVRGVGEKAVEAVIGRAEGTRALHEPVRFLPSASICGTVQRSTIEAMVKCGAFASAGGKALAASAGAGSSGGDGPAVAAG